MSDIEISEILRTIFQAIDLADGRHVEDPEWHSVGVVVHPSTNLIYQLECESTYHINIKDGNVMISNYNPGRPQYAIWSVVAEYNLADPKCFEKVVDKAFKIWRIKNRKIGGEHTAMNRECNGEWFKVDGQDYYRCLGDGSATKLSARRFETCPTCNREIVGNFAGELIAKVLIEKYVLVPIGDSGPAAKTVIERIEI